MSTKSIYCSRCGTYLGEAELGFMKAVQCFCGEITELKTTPQISNADTDALSLLAYD